MSFFKNLTDHVRTLNSNILIVDGTNTFIRGMSVSRFTNDNGEPIGGYTAFLLSLGAAIKKLKPTRCIIVFDGINGSIQRKNIFPDYKKSRNHKKEKPRNDIYETVAYEDKSMKIQLGRLVQYLRLFPVQLLIINRVEADDVIAQLCIEFPNSKKYIMSTDQDFYQLVNEKTFIYSPTKKIIIDEKYIIENFDMLAKNYILLKTLNGDVGDDVPGIKGAGLKTLQKRIPILFEKKEINLDEFYSYLNSPETDTKYKIVKDIKEQKENVERNYTLMQLEKPLLKPEQINEIKTVLKSPIPKLNTFSFLKYSAVDGLEGAIKNTQKWVNDVFIHLTNHVKI